jgi:CO/xanthine dehydrogenase Mo-binding subunit
MASEYSVIGKAMPRHDAVDKVLGVPVFASDYALPGMLYGAVYRSTHASARLVSVDTSAAEALPGVVAVLTAHDVPNNEISMTLPGRMAEATAGGQAATQPVLATERVRFIGEPIALIAAESQAIADEARDLIRVEYEPRPGVFDPLEAMKPDAPQVHPGGNVLAQWKIRKGDVEAGFHEADIVLERTYRTQFIDHAYLETESGVGWIDEQGVLTLRVGTQVIEHFRDVAEVLTLPHNKVRLVGAYMGGGFGGKEDVTVEILLGLLVWKTRRPVKLVFSREESLVGHAKRHPYVIRYKLGARRDGRITALEAELISDAGAYAYLSVWVLLYSAVTATGPYRIPHVKVDAATVYTNNIYTSAMRCFGSTQSCFAYESHMDEMARALGMDPLELRRINYLRQGDAMGTGQEVESEPLLYETATGAWEALGPRASPSPGRAIGRGLASSLTPYGRMCWTRDTSHAWVGAEVDGTFLVRAGVPDHGGGQASSLVSIAAEVLGIPMDRITVHIADSQLTPLSGTTTATRQLYMAGNAVLRAAQDLRRTLLEQAADLFEAPPEILDIRDGEVFVVEDPSRRKPIAHVVRAAAAAGRPISFLGKFNAPVGETIDPHTGQGKAFPDFTYGTQAAEVEVDLETGKVWVRQLTSCYDVGRAVNRQSVEGQLEGGAVMGIGYALTEDCVLEQGALKTRHLAEYLLPTAMDCPDIKTILIESGNGLGPFGAKGVGEPSLTPTAAAIANAVRDAIGARVHELPITPERVFMTLHAEGRQP